ncbi:PTS system fructose-specific transporter subunit IIBC [Enterobacter asburiae]|uniref:PTS system fructose-specific transporter subunit IIBC n=1 Tax=Enterobacter asburiae TaxID=61645 RepID=A0A376FL77_ENTAS|nr:PTS system fructose-specific transporter subunit IIBC [Enterobacter asburiae]
MYRTSTGLALKKTAQEFDKALVEAKPYQATGARQTATEGKKESAGAYRHLLTGVSYMLPMVVAAVCVLLSRSHLVLPPLKSKARLPLR